MSDEREAIVLALIEATKELAYQARNSCEANRYPALTEALHEADYQVNRASGRFADFADHLAPKE